MDEHLKHRLIEILKHEVVPALGCTEPVAVALAAAWARRAAGGAVDRVNVAVDKNIYKNGLCVGVPGTGQIGLHIAAAIGAVAGNPESGLEVLRDIDATSLEKAKNLVDTGQVKVEIESTAEEIYVHALVSGPNGQGAATIRGRHDNVVCVTVNDAPYEGFTPPKDGAGTLAAEPAGRADDIRQFCLADLFAFATRVELDALVFLQPALEVNLRFAHESMAQQGHTSVGTRLGRLMTKGLVSEDFSGKTKRMVASAVEYRMEGANLPVMSCAGSGNQGLISTLPVLVAAEFAEADDALRLRAAVLSYLVTIYVKAHMGVLTPVCGGNVASGMGACCAVVFIFGGGLAEIERAINNMAGSVMGVICDGAKVGCALKASMAVGVAIDNALLALEGMSVPTGDGIVDESVDQTIRNMGFVTTPGMANTDDAILEVMGQQRTKGD